MPLSKDLIRQALSRLTPPGSATDIVSSGALAWVASCDGVVSLRIALPGLEPRQLQGVAAGCFQAIKARSGGEPLRSLTVEFVDPDGSVCHTASFGQTSDSDPGQAGHRPIGGLAPPAGGLGAIRHVVAVGAGKGGVGKSTVAVNLAVGLARRGHAVGLLDADIYGPSLPTMLGLDALDQVALAGRLQPFLVHGVKAITIGKLVDPDKPLIWRGPMAHGAFKQLTDQTDWGELDYLIIDLPPGTGDVPLTMAQTMSLTGAVIVCTPQKVAQDDAARAARMFEQLKVETLGVVENMSTFIADDGVEYDIFGRGGAEQMAQRLRLPFLGRVPITMSLRENSDRGDPSANFEPRPGARRAKADEVLAKALDALLTNLEAQVALAAMRSGHARPSLTIR